MLRSLLQKLGLIIGGILIAFVIAEIAVRVLGLAPAEFYSYDRYAGWKIKPYAYGWQTHEGNALMQANSDGFRGPEYTVPKPPGTLRIAISNRKPRLRSAAMDVRSASSPTSR